MTNDTTDDWPKPWSEVRTFEEKDDGNVGYDEAYVPLGAADDTARIYDGTVYVADGAGEHDRKNGDAWYPLRIYVEEVLRAT